MNKTQTSYKQNLEKNGIEISFSDKPEKNTEQKNTKNVSLWDICNGEIKKIPKKDLEDLGIIEINKLIRKHLLVLKQFNFKISVSKHNSSIWIKISESPFKVDSKILKTVKNYIKNVAENYQYCWNYDPYSDYGSSYNFYVSSIDTYDCKIVEMDKEFKTQILKNWGEKFKIDVEQKKQQREKQFKEFQEKQKQQEILNKIAEQKEQQQIEVILKNIEIKKLDEKEFYILKSVSFPNLNKNNTLKQYKEEHQKNDCSCLDTQIQNEINFTSIEAYSYFCNLLLNDFDFIKSCEGGSYTNDEWFTTYTDIDYMGNDLIKKIHWINIGIAVKCNNELKFIVNNEGYNYCRYVGFHDGKIQDHYNFKDLNLLKDFNQNTEKANNLIDISSSIVSNNNLPNLTKMTKDEEQTYFELLKQELIKINFKLTKEIIRLIPKEYELFKGKMYIFYFNQKTVKEQIKTAIEQKKLIVGKNYTLIWFAGMGMITCLNVKITAVDFVQYAQYKNAVKINYVQAEKRKEYYSYFHSDLIIYENHIKLDDEILNDVKYENGFKITSSKFLACDKQNFEAIINHFKEENIIPVVNTTDFI